MAPSATVIIPDASKTLSAQETRHLKVLEKRIAAGLQTFREVGSALLEIRDSRLYRESHGSFEAYCAERWALPRSRAYQLIESAKVVTVLGDPPSLANEAQARELFPLVDDPVTAKKVLTAATQRAEETNRPLTAGLIREVRDEFAPGLKNGNGNGNGHDTPTERLMQDIVRLGNSFQRWRETKPKIGDRQKVKAAVTKLVSIIS